MSVGSVVGALLSKYDETALEGVSLLVRTAQKDAAFLKKFLSESHALTALMTTFERKCDMAPVFNCGVTLLELTARRPEQMLLVRELTSGQPFTQIIRHLGQMNEDRGVAIVAALSLARSLVEYAPHVAFRRFRKQVPLDLEVLKVDQIPFALFRVREARTRFLMAFLSKPQRQFLGQARDIASTAIVQHGFATKLLEDGGDLFMSGEPQAQALVVEALHAFREHFVSSKAIPASKKREILASQRNILRVLTRALAIGPLATEVAVVLRTLVVEITEPSFDYGLSRSDDDQRMPNHLLLLLLRALKPRQRLVDSHLVTFILHNAPDLIRPYFVRVSRHLTEEDQGVTTTMANLATCNLLTRLFLLDFPLYISERLARLKPATASASTLFELTPAAAADEICPTWLQQFIHKLVIRQEDPMQLVFAMQCTQAAIDRASALKAAIRELFEQRIAALSTTPSTGSFDGADQHTAAAAIAEMREEYEASLDALLRERLPQREEFQHRLTQQLLPAVSPKATGNDAIAEDTPQRLSTYRNAQQQNGSPSDSALAAPTAHFVIQRMYLLMRSYTRLFNLRVAWISAMPTPQYSWKPGQQLPQIMNEWQPATVASLCALLTSSMALGVTTPKLHHITMGGGGGGSSNAAKKGKKGKNDKSRGDDDGATTSAGSSGALSPPPLMELLLWAVNARQRLVEGEESSDDSRSALLWVYRLLLWTLHGVSHHSDADLGEIDLWVAALRPDQVPAMLHLFNAMLQQSLSKASDRIAKQLREGPNGILVTAMESFIARTETKFAESSPNDAWQRDLVEQIAGVRRTIKNVVANWNTRDEQVRELLQISSTESGGSVAGAKLLATASATALRANHLSRMNGAVQRANAVARARQPLHTLFVEFMMNAAANPLLASDEVREVVANVAEASVSKWAKLIAKSASKRSEPSPWLANGHLGFTAAAWLLDLPGAVLSAASNSAGDAATTNAARVAVAEALLANRASFPADVVDGPNQQLELLGVNLAVLAAASVLCRCHVDGSGDVLPADVITNLQEQLVAGYRATLSVQDRVQFATLAALESLGSPASEAADNSDDDNDSASSASDSDEDEGQDDSDDEALAEKRKRGERGTEKAKKSKQRGPRHFKTVSALNVFVQRRFVVGGALPAPLATVEADVLTQTVEGWADADVANIALRMPLGLSTRLVRSKEEVSAPGGAASVPPPTALRIAQELIFPDVAPADIASGAAHMSVVTSPDPDPRFVLPLMETVAAARAGTSRAMIPASTVTHLTPIALRALSSTNWTTRAGAMNVLATLYGLMSPVDRIIVNSARLYISSGSMSSSGHLPRLPTPLTTFMVHAFHWLHDDTHPLHPITRDAFEDKAIQLPPNRGGLNFPLGSLLYSFPTECVTATQLQEQQRVLQADAGAGGGKDMVLKAVAAPPHLAAALRSLRFSAQYPDDMRALRRGGVLRSVMSLVGLLASSPLLRDTIIDTLDFLIGGSGASIRIAAKDFVPWCLMHLQQLTFEADIRRCGEYVTKLVCMLQRVYPYFTAGPSLHRQYSNQLQQLGAAIAATRVVAPELPPAIKALVDGALGKAKYAETMARKENPTAALAKRPRSSKTQKK